MRNASRFMVSALVLVAVALPVLFAGEDGDPPAAPQPGEHEPGASDPVESAPATPEVAGETGPARPKPVNDPRFHAQLKAIAQVYKGFGRVDDDLRWAPFKCDMPRPSKVRFSASADADTHGRRLYWLYAKQHTDYVWKWDRENPVPVGQAIVKESWIAEPVAQVPEKPARKETRKIVGDGEVQIGWERSSVAPAGKQVDVESYIDPYAVRDGKAFHAQAVYGLFVMFRLAADTEGTDHGWVYGTLTPDGKTVTSAGRVAACMKCHAEAPRERLFGLPAR